MKGNIPAELVAVLRDKNARKELRELLISGRNGRVRAGGKSYRLHIDEGQTVVTRKAAPALRGIARALTVNRGQVLPRAVAGGGVVAPRG